MRFVWQMPATLYAIGENGIAPRSKKLSAWSSRSRLAGRRTCLSAQSPNTPCHPERSPNAFFPSLRGLCGRFFSSLGLRKSLLLVLPSSTSSTSSTSVYSVPSVYSGPSVPSVEFSCLRFVSRLLCRWKTSAGFVQEARIGGRRKDGAKTEFCETKPNYD